MTYPIRRVAMDELEARAAIERQRLHENVVELRQVVRDRLDAKRYVRDNPGRTVLIIGVVGLALGYLTAGVLVSAVRGE
jgi:ElaB/YqjD/DUF883 family membrane-anchored ribosome-binding protein